MKSKLILFLTIAFCFVSLNSEARIKTYSSEGCQADPSQILFVLDISSSMLNNHKIEKARAALKDYVGKIPDSYSTGLLTFYGCTQAAIKYVVPIAPDNANAVSAAADAATPVRGTALALALKTAEGIIGSSGQCMNIVVFSDGKESCGGDPEAAAGNLAKACSCVSVIGIGTLTDAEQDQLDKVSNKGNGTYCKADNEKGIDDCLTELDKIRQKRNKCEKEEKKGFPDPFNTAAPTDGCDGDDPIDGEIIPRPKKKKDKIKEKEKKKKKKVCRPGSRDPDCQDDGSDPKKKKKEKEKAKAKKKKKKTRGGGGL